MSYSRNENKWHLLLLFTLYCYYLIFTTSELFKLKRDGIICHGNLERDLQGTILVREGREQRLRVKTKRRVCSVLSEAL